MTGGRSPQMDQGEQRSPAVRPELLVVDDLSIELFIGGRASPVVDSVSFSVARGQSLGVVGESGSGKSMTALALLGLLPRSARVASGSVRLNGTELAGAGERQLQAVRGRHVGMVFQDPMSSLNPALRIGDQITEGIRRHTHLSRRGARTRAIELLDEVGIPNAARRLDDYPHQYSGGMRQRVMIAIALSCNPSLLIADEPTTALDLTVQASILKLLARLRDERGLALILITHDLGVMAQMVDEVMVMYAGQVVERAETMELFESPEHPYTEALTGLIPAWDDPAVRHGRFPTLPGQPPSATELSDGCRVAARCPYAGDESGCEEGRLVLRETSPGHWVRTSHPASVRRTS
jgi:peptide/nickel transport system ATP-binding protein